MRLIKAERARIAAQGPRYIGLVLDRPAKCAYFFANPGRRIGATEAFVERNHVVAPGVRRRQQDLRVRLRELVNVVQQGPRRLHAVEQVQGDDSSELSRGERRGE